MTHTEKLEMLEVMTGETDEVMLSTYLTIAGQKVLRKVYPYGADGREMPEQYDTIHVEIACYLINKRGAEGQLTHSENGVSRTYGNGDVPPSLMREIVPFASTV